MDLVALAEGVKSGDRRALARSITLVESGRADHRAQALQLLQALGQDKQALRIGLSGTPGVGKSTFIESFGLMLTAQGLKVAVLAVDPSSARSGGSILGDKTRMERLSRDRNAFIRPSPSQAQMGGVARRTREAVALCEAAGFDVVLIETVGVGQSETVVAELSDLFILLLAPAGGDELQGVKRGIMEIADLIVVNKADINPQAANVARSQIKSALGMLRHASPHWTPPVLMMSALQKQGIAEFWNTIGDYREAMQASGEFDARRRHQARAWMWELIDQGLRARFAGHARVQQDLPGLQEAVEAGQTTPAAAAMRLLGYLG